MNPRFRALEIASERSRPYQEGAFAFGCENFGKQVFTMAEMEKVALWYLQPAIIIGTSKL